MISTLKVAICLAALGGCMSVSGGEFARARNTEIAPLKTDKPPASEASGGVADLPFSRGRTFQRLDDYLAYRKSLGPQDIPYYVLVRPGVYELMTMRAPGEAPQTFTRQQLLERFGFKD
jgi:hypothetical protein